jgi:GTPase SAR1 family protein
LGCSNIKRFQTPKNGGPYKPRIIRSGVSMQFEIHIDFLNHMTQKDPRTDAILICFALDNPKSFENARTKWYPLLHDMNISDIPVILCGTKPDKRAINLTKEHGAQLARELGVQGM